MRSPNRNRPNHRSTALCLISLLFAVFLLAAPAAAGTTDTALADSTMPQGNTAVFTLSENGTILFVEATLINQDTYLLLSMGLLGEDAELPAQNVELIGEDGNAVEPENTKGTLTFPEGNYTLRYSYPVTDNLIYARFADDYHVVVTMPAPYTTGHMILGTISGDGKIVKSDEGTTVTFEKTKIFSITFYDDSREMILYVFLGIWLVLLALAYAKYRKIKKNREKI